MDIQPLFSCLTTVTRKKIVFIKSYLTGESNKNKLKIVNAGHFTLLQTECLINRKETRKQMEKIIDPIHPLILSKTCMPQPLFYS